MAAPLRVQLAVLAGARTKQLTLRLPTVIGRGGTANIKLPASTVSRHHCEIYGYEGQVVVRDLASSNGTLVNGHKIMGPTFLGPQDELTVGPVTMRLSPLEANTRRPPSSPTNATPEDDLAELKEALPELANLPAAEGLPVTATSADAERIDPATDDSVLRYAEPVEPGPSFVDIQIDSAEDTPVDAEDLPQDAALQDFLRGLDS